MSNAAKYRKKAAEFEQLRQVDRAIASYIKAIEQSEMEGHDVDVALFNKVGDLTLRQGRVADAVTYYERAVEHYATAGLFNNAIALCNKILRSAPGRANVYFSLGRICARKGMRGDATRNFLEYAQRMQQDGRVDEGMRALAEIADLMPELEEVRRLVEEHATRAGITLPQRRTPSASHVALPPVPARREHDRSTELVFIDLGDPDPVGRRTPPMLARVRTPPTPVKGIEYVEPPTQEPAVPVVEGLDVLPRANDHDTGPLEGLTSDDEQGRPGDLDPLEALESLGEPVAELTWLVPDHAIDDVVEADGLMPTDEGTPNMDRGHDVMSGLLAEESDELRATSEVVGVVGGIAGQPPAGAAELRRLTPLDISPIPELDAAIEAGAIAAERANADELSVVLRPPFRLDPHDFILPGELPPMVVDDALMERGLEQALRGFIPAVADPAVRAWTDDASVAGDTAADHIPVDGAIDDSSVDTLLSDDDVEWLTPDPIAYDDKTDDAQNAADLSSDRTSVELFTDDDDVVRDDAQVEYAVHSTPSLPIAAVAIEANAVAASRCDELRAAVAMAPRDWGRRRRLAEALFEVGEREAGLSELQTALTGFAQSGALEAAADIADELVSISPSRIPYHQKRVELAVRLNDQGRLRVAYLDLADTLVSDGDEVRAHAVFGRVLELDPWDERARTALGSSAPPSPPPASKPDGDYVDLATWLRDDAPISTRMRMQEPTVTGDEQADFDALLRHFKEGVARSVGEEDFESRYDLGVAYKEMGLLDDAIAEFQKALRSSRHRLPAYEALGQCFVEQQRYSVAATVLTRPLHEPGLTDENLIGVLYLLAYSCEALQRQEEARSYYSRVYATDINFRDAAARLAALDQITQ